MSATEFLRSWRSGAVPVFCFLLTHLGGCAELQAAAQSDNIAREDTPDVQLAQADSAQNPAISPLLDAAPEVFEATGRAVWDGKRTLQGIWVAHPLAKSARRVRIFNTKSGAAVDGALFKRDASLSDTSVLISSEAAQMLGMEVGKPTQLRIVAVTPRKKQASEAITPAKPPADEKKPVAVESEKAAAEGAGNTPTAAKPEREPDEEVAAKPEVTADETPLEERVFKFEKQDSEPDEKIAAKPEAATEGTPAVKDDTPAEERVFKFEKQEPEPGKKPKPKPAPVESETATALKDDPVKAGTKPAPAKTVKSAAREAEPDKKTPPKEERTFKFEKAEDPKPAAKDTEPEVASLLAKPYVQAGIFGVKTNAEKLIARLEAKGIPALGRSVKSGGKTLTRVLAGPFKTRSERNQAQSDIRKMGLRDAVPVKR